ncbi:MAG: quinolinate synthase NadA [Oscillospiraceae bacterium]|nr:quinolinate synthase NadA [Oscillospiraceae bacterium]
MKIHEMQKKIAEIKKEKNILLLAHSYQAREIIEVADFTGDSFQLSVAADKAKEQTVIMCGVRFMAETVKILSPEKRVFLANPTAGCPMAEQMDIELIEGVKKTFPDYTVVAYINTTAALKTISDVCVTSSSAVKIVDRIDNDNILFIPDCNLGAYVAKQLPHKNIKLLQGGCPIHAAVSVEDVVKAKADYPGALFLVHPECVPEVVELGDFVGSTSAIMDYAANSKHKEFLIGTEMSIAENLQYTCPDKNFYCLSQKLLCPNMKVTTLVDVLNCVSGKGGEEITLDEQTIKAATGCIERMLNISNSKK